MAYPKGESILTTERQCWYTHRTDGLEIHHVMNGTADRKKADEDGLWLYVTHSRHEWLHNTPDGKKAMRKLKALAQRKYEETHSHDEWMRRYHKNYV